MNNEYSGSINDWLERKEREKNKEQTFDDILCAKKKKENFGDTLRSQFMEKCLPEIVENIKEELKTKIVENNSHVFYKKKPYESSDITDMITDALLKDGLYLLNMDEHIVISLFPLGIRELRKK